MSKKIEQLTALTAPALGDLLPIVDIDASNVVKKITISDLMKLFYPVGCIYTTIISTNPATVFGFGTWVAFGAGRVMVGLDSGQTEFDTVEETGGEKTHTLIEAEIPAHTHIQNAHNHGLTRFPTTTGASSGFTADTSMSGTPAAVTQATDNATPTNQNTGGGGAHNNLQPYIVVYMWKRTA